MSNLQKFIKNRNLELTLFNESGESAYIGEASDIIPKKSNTLLRFPVSTPLKHVLPLSIAVLHSGSRIFSTLYVTPVKDTNSITTVELLLSNDG